MAAAGMRNRPLLSNIQATQPAPPSLPSAELEDFADLAGGAVAVVGEHFAEDGHAAGTVALVSDLVEAAAFELAGAALDGPLDVLLGHADGLGVIDGVAEAEVGVGVAAAVLWRQR